jgi:hypothetical protein
VVQSSVSDGLSHAVFVFGGFVDADWYFLGTTTDRNMQSSHGNVPELLQSAEHIALFAATILQDRQVCPDIPP